MSPIGTPSRSCHLMNKPRQLKGGPNRLRKLEQFLQCLSLALFGPGAMSPIRSLLGEERTLIVWTMPNAGAGTGRLCVGVSFSVVR
jgi:hypothetical protein